MRLADFLERVARFLLRYWYLDVVFVVTGSFLLFLSLKLREKDVARVNRGDGVLLSGGGGDVDTGLKDGTAPEADLGGIPVYAQGNGEAEGRTSPNEAGDKGDEA